MLTRRQFIQLGAVGGAGILVAPRSGRRRARAGAATGQTPLPGNSIAQFTDPMGIDY